MATVIERIPFHETELVAQRDGDGFLVSIRHACDNIGVDYSRQLKKLREKTWATVVLKATVADDGKSREMAMIDRRTFTMWLATIEPSRVAPEVRPVLDAFQSEAADALDAYFHEGGAINPAATVDQLDVLARRAQSQAGVLSALKGIVDEHYLEVQGRFLIAQALGVEPELDPETMPVDVESYLDEAGVSRVERVRIRSSFGKRLKGAYIAKHGVEPLKVPRTINGTIQQVYGYTRRDLPVFDQIFESMGLVRS
ncbi:MAG: phage antirepressor [Herbiconiux sp.]|uniref:phage antirepressor N-terminal domain-containing protein n=1 Tax=Herbiconiux sp. TaxID=1871186 RepID=UPI0012041D25|nr:phage antirepressor N-terminal domain-containing protein [Herbiconiux sp.]TAJ46333.1 MAG: phage antirepressor [Herbiconiux sp.]